MGCHFFLQGNFPTQGLNSVSGIAGGFFTNGAPSEAQGCLVGLVQTPLIKQTTAPSLNLKVRCDLGLQVLSEWASCVQ